MNKRAFTFWCVVVTALLTLAFVKTAEWTFAPAGDITLHTNEVTQTITFSNNPAMAAAAGDSGAIQFNQGDVIDGTNVFVYHRTNATVTGPIGYYANNSTLTFGLSSVNKLQVLANSVRAGASNTIDSGEFLIPWRTNWVDYNVVKFGLLVGTANAATITNIMAASATLDFPITGLGAVADLPITVTGAASGDVVEIGVPQGSATGVVGSYSAFASNNTVYVRFTSTLAGADPASGTFKAIVFKF